MKTDKTKLIAAVAAVLIVAMLISGGTKISINLTGEAIIQAVGLIGILVITFVLVWKVMKL